MITASHNPPIFNGFKLKSFYGGSSDPQRARPSKVILDRNPVQICETAGRSDRAGQITYPDVARRITPR